jgi:proteasome lid subunit RPN8/RPN11
VITTLRPAAAADLRRMAAAAYPDEGCGVLVGVRGAELVEVVQVTQGRNLVDDRRRDRYELDPSDILRAERSARARNLDVVGFWHTHPDHPARPSRFDTERAWADYVYVICGVTAAGVDALGAFELDPSGEFVDVPLHEAVNGNGEAVAN